MFSREEFAKTLHSVLFESGKPAKAIAAEIHTKYNYLARMVQPSESGCNFPSHLLADFMIAAGNFSPLRLLAKACGFLLVPVPCVVGLRSVEGAIPHFLKSHSRAIESLVDVLEIPGDTEKQIANALLIAHQEETERLRQALNAGRIEKRTDKTERIRDDRSMQRVQESDRRKAAV